MTKCFCIAAAVVIVSIFSGCMAYYGTVLALAPTKGTLDVITLQGEHTSFDVRMRKHDNRILLRGLSPEDERRAVTVWVANIGDEAIGTNSFTWPLDVLDNPPEDGRSWHSNFKRIVIAPGERKFLYRGPLAGLTLDGGPQRSTTRVRVDVAFDEAPPKPIRVKVGWERWYP